MQQLPMTYSDRAERRCNKDSNDYKQFMLYRSMLEYKTLLMKIIMTDLNEWKSWSQVTQFDLTFPSLNGKNR